MISYVQQKEKFLANKARADAWARIAESEEFADAMETAILMVTSGNLVSNTMEESGKLHFQIRGAFLLADTLSKLHKPMEEKKKETVGLPQNLSHKQ